MNHRDVDAGGMFEEHPELEAFAADLRRAAAESPAPRVGATLAAVLDGSAAPAPSDLAVPVARRRRLPLSPRGRLRLVLASGVTAAVVFVAAAGGGLPQPAQRNVSRLADRVGIELPDGDASTEADAGPDAPTTTTPSVPPAVVPTTPSTVTPAVVPDAVADDDAADDLPVAPTTTTGPPWGPPDEGEDPDDRGQDDEVPDDRDDEQDDAGDGVESRGEKRRAAPVTPAAPTTFTNP